VNSSSLHTLLQTLASLESSLSELIIPFTSLKEWDHLDHIFSFDHRFASSERLVLGFPSSVLQVKDHLNSAKLPSTKRRMEFRAIADL
jgi:hypothetical protein